MLLFGSLYKLSSRDSAHIVWRRMFCVLQESALLWYCGWAHGWRGCPLAAAAVAAVEPARHPLLSRLPYTSAISNTCFEIATPQKSYLVRGARYSLESLKCVMLPFVGCSFTPKMRAVRRSGLILCFMQSIMLQTTTILHWLNA
jgi:hypothetical protein